jgi:hypothetical protein
VQGDRAEPGISGQVVNVLPGRPVDVAEVQRALAQAAGDPRRAEKLERLPTLGFTGIDDCVAALDAANNDVDLTAEFLATNVQCGEGLAELEREGVDWSEWERNMELYVADGEARAARAVLKCGRKKLDDRHLDDVFFRRACGVEYHRIRCKGISDGGGVLTRVPSADPRFWAFSRRAIGRTLLTLKTMTWGVDRSI